MFGLATLAEAFRYGLLVFNRVRLVDPLTLAISDAMVWSTQLSGPLVAVAAAVAVACGCTSNAPASSPTAGSPIPPAA